jgi:hypothetical protein
MTNAVPGRDLMMMATDPLGGRLVQALDVVDESHVALDELAAGGDVIRWKSLLRHEIIETGMESVSHRLGQQPCHLVKRTGFNCFIGGRDRRAKIAAGWLEPGIGGTFTRAMDAHQRLEEIAIGLRVANASLKARRISLMSSGRTQIRTRLRSPVCNAMRAAPTTGPSRPSQWARAGVASITLIAAKTMTRARVKSVVYFVIDCTLMTSPILPKDVDYAQGKAML